MGSGTFELSQSVGLSGVKVGLPPQEGYKPQNGQFAINKQTGTYQTDYLDDTFHTLKTGDSQ